MIYRPPTNHLLTSYQPTTNRPPTNHLSTAFWRCSLFNISLQCYTVSVTEDFMWTYIYIYISLCMKYMLPMKCNSMQMQLFLFTAAGVIFKISHWGFFSPWNANQTIKLFVVNSQPYQVLTQWEIKPLKKTIKAVQPWASWKVPPSLCQKERERMKHNNNNKKTESLAHRRNMFKRI